MRWFTPVTKAKTATPLGVDARGIGPSYAGGIGSGDEANVRNKSASGTSGAAAAA